MNDLEVQDAPGVEDESSSSTEMTKGSMLGCLYVLEGSALGAQIIIRRLSEIGLGAHFGARHLASQIASPHAWQSFLAVLEGTPLVREEEDACVDMAIKTFQRFERAYDVVG
jgi:heme oxygenase